MSAFKYLHTETPLLRSEHLSSLLNHNVLIKMESSQVGGSFKIRGIGNCSQKAVKNGCKKLIGCSGGNAGIAVSHAAKLLNVPSVVYVPESTSRRSIELMVAQGATVIVKGKDYATALTHAVEEGEKEGNILIHAYDHPDIWKGHSTIIHEIQKELIEKPSTIVVAVGGGGLLIGILEGMEEVGWTDVPVLAMETYGAHCFNLSVRANKVVPLEDITSIAKTLGARTIPQHLLDILPRFNVFSEVVTDKQAVYSCLQFAEDECTVVEPSCGATLSAIYCNVLSKLVSQKYIHLKDGPVVIIVSGGSGASLNMLKNWSKELDHST